MTITLTPQQSAAVKAIAEWYGDTSRLEFYLAGYAGTGKSTLTEIAIKEIKDRYGVKKVRTGAYTGKAAHVLRKKGAENARTIHSMTYRLIEDDRTGQPKFELDPHGAAATAEMIVLDECSMIDEAMAADLRSFGKKILVLGDPGQLPPVKGQGAFTNRKPDAFLTEIHRQAAGSPILRLATMARLGEMPGVGDYGDGVRVVPYDANAGQWVYDRDTQVICGLNRMRWTMTQRIRAQRGYDGNRPLVGERVLCCRNNRELGLFNGQLGIMRESKPSKEIGPPHIEMLLDMDDVEEPIKAQVHPYLFDQHFEDNAPRPKIGKGVCEFDWGYVLTCHKSQGSQWPRITVIDDSRSFREDRWKWLYTAITRAESELTIITRGAS